MSVYLKAEEEYFRDFRKDNWDVEVYCREIMCIQTNKFLNLCTVV